MKKGLTGHSAPIKQEDFIDFIDDVFGNGRTTGGIYFYLDNADEAYAIRRIDWIESHYESITHIDFVTEDGVAVGGLTQDGQTVFFKTPVSQAAASAAGYFADTFEVTPDLIGYEPVWVTVNETPASDGLDWYESLARHSQHDATLIGEFPAENWSKTIDVLYSSKGARTARDRWRPMSGTLAELVAKFFTKHKIGPKDGPAMVFGSGAARAAKSMKTACMIGLDVDNGADMEAVHRRIAERGVMAISYTTHSHMRAHTDIAQDSLLRALDLDLDGGEELTRDMIVSFLVHEKGIDPDIFKGNFGDVDFVHEDQPVYRIKHKPIPRFRLIFPLEEPYVFASANESHKDRIERFKRRVRGLSNMIGLRIDESCLDPSRLFYLPTHADGNRFDLTLLGGSLLDFDSMPEADSTRGNTNAFAEAAADIVKSGPMVTAGGMSLKKWAATYADGFEIRDMIEEEAPDKLRDPCSGHAGRHTICPFDDHHSNAGDPDDMGFFVRNGSDGDGFSAHCMHDSCKGRDRLEFIQQMIADNWFDESVLTDEDYVQIVAETEREYERKEKMAIQITGMEDITKALKILDGEDVTTVNAILDTLARINPSAVERGHVMATLKKITKLPISDIREDFKKLRGSYVEEEARLAEEDADRKADRGIIYTDLVSFEKMVRQAWTRIARQQSRDPKLFWSDLGYVVRMTEAAGAPKLQRADQAIIMHAASKACDWKTKTMDGPNSNAPPTDMIKIMMACEEKETRLPMLKGILNAPFFTENGDMVAEPGYDESGYYLFDPKNTEYPPVPAEPTQLEIKQAKDLIFDNIFIDFPFDDNTNGDASRCHALCMLMQPFVRAMIQGPTPIYFVNKPLPGSGASLLISLILAISTGRPAEARTLPSHEDEIRKSIMAGIKGGEPYMWYDNVDRTISSQALASVTTADTYSDRLLGQTETVRVPVRNQWIICGNNVDMRSEMVRRTALIQLDPKMPDPTIRKGFKHKHIAGWVSENRADLVHAVLVLVQAWIAAGRPRGEGMKATYEVWASVMSGIMDVIGVEGFMGNEEILKLQSDTEEGPLSEFIYLWHTTYGDTAIGIGSDSRGGGEGLVGLMEDMQIPLATGNSEDALRKTLGRKVRTYAGRQFNVETDDGIIVVSLDVIVRRGRANLYSLALVDEAVVAA